MLVQVTRRTTLTNSKAFDKLSPNGKSPLQTKIYLHFKHLLEGDQSPPQMQQQGHSFKQFTCLSLFYSFPHVSGSCWVIQKKKKTCNLRSHESTLNMTSPSQPFCIQHKLSLAERNHPEIMAIRLGLCISNSKSLDRIGIWILNHADRTWTLGFPNLGPNILPIHKELEFFMICLFA